MKPKNILLVLLVLIFSIAFIGLSVKGASGSPIDFQTNYNTRVGGPFESSGSSSRYALTEAIAKDHTFFLNDKLAKIAAPDLVEYKGKFLTVFTPGVSLLGVPFYLLGEIFGLQQLFAYLTISLLAVLNIFLIAKLAMELGVNKYVGILSGLIFAFATNALSYGTTFTQHEASTTVVLLALLNSIGERTWLKNIIFGFLVGAGALMDIPNLFFLVPVGLYIIFKNIRTSETRGKIKISLKTAVVGLVIGLIPLLGVFAYYNHQTTGSYTKIGQFIGRVKAPSEAATTQPAETSKIVLLNTPFQTRIELSSFYILTLSDERSWLFYSPVVLLGILGLFIAIKEKKNKDLAVLLTAVAAVNIILYSMFDDPWGGWAFGPRYLIPAAALLCVALGVSIQKLRRNYIFIIVFLLILFYSVAVNTLGAITTQSIPPKVEAINLTQPIPYTYEYNLQLLKNGKVSSLLYNIGIKKYLNSFQFWLAYTSAAFLFLTVIYFLSWREKERGND